MLQNCGILADYFLAILSTTNNPRRSRELRLDHCFLNGKDIAYLLHSMTEEPGRPRELHLDVSENNIEQDLDKMTKAITSGLAPSSLTIRLLEFETGRRFSPDDPCASSKQHHPTIRYIASVSPVRCFRERPV